MKYRVVKHFLLKFGSLSPAVTLKIKSRSPKPNQLFIVSQCYIHANLVKIHQPVHIVQTRNCHANADAKTDGIHTKTIWAAARQIQHNDMCA